MAESTAASVGPIPHAPLAHKTGFLDLPRELRDLIYSFATGDAISDVPRRHKQSKRLRCPDYPGVDPSDHMYCFRHTLHSCLNMNLLAAHPIIARELSEILEQQGKPVNWILSLRNEPGTAKPIETVWSELLDPAVRPFVQHVTLQVPSVRATDRPRRDACKYAAARPRREVEALTLALVIYSFLSTSAPALVASLPNLRDINVHIMGRFLIPQPAPCFFFAAGMLRLDGCWVHDLNLSSRNHQIRCCIPIDRLETWIRDAKVRVSST